MTHLRRGEEVSGGDRLLIDRRDGGLDVGHVER
jgi:hypothetical protein